MAKDNKPPRMTRAQITEALDTIPLDSILSGANTEARLTAKQKAFARNLALGKSKAQAYRDVYSDKGTKKTQANAGYRMAKSSDIDAIKKAYEVAIEAAKQRTPAQLRELVIHQLTAHAIDQDIPPAQRIQALKLLGTVSEVAAFTERKEVHTVKRSEDVRAALMDKLRTITGSAVEGELVTDHNGADSLLAEINAGHAANAEENSQLAAEDDPDALDPTPCPPPDQTFTTLSQDLHNVLHSEPVEKSVLHSDTSEISVPHSQAVEKSNRNLNLDSPNISYGEVIGVDEHVSSYIEIIEPIVAEKAPADDPTPSDMEHSPASSETEKG